MLEINNVYKIFNPNTINEKRALNGLNLKLNEGDFVTVIGGNGVSSYQVQRPCMGDSKKEHEHYRELVASLGLGLEDRITAKVGLLSGGQRQAITLLMATLQKPKLLLLDEHTAALDPKTAEKVLALTDTIVKEHHLTALMITHNMKDALRLGNRLIMMNAGKVIFDVSGEEKKKLEILDLLEKFEQVSGGRFANDRMILN